MKEAGVGHLSLWQKAGILLQRSHYLLGHLEADVGAELEQFTHLFRGGWDQGNFLCILFEPLYELIIA